MTVSLNTRKSLIGIEGAPLTEYFTVQFPIQSEYMGLGLRYMHDKIGATVQNGLDFTYAYQIGLGDGSLSLALDGGFYNYSIDFLSLVVADKEFDAAIPQQTDGQLIPDFNFAMFYNLNSLYFGYSIYNLSKGTVSFPATSYVGGDVLSKFQYITVGANVEVERGIYFEPMLLTKIGKSSPVQVDVIASLKYKKLFHAGLLYRTGDGIAFLCNMGFQDGLYKVGYSYDLSFSTLGAQTKGSHEISLMYSLELTPPASQKDLNPIYYVE